MDNPPPVLRDIGKNTPKNVDTKDMALGEVFHLN